MKPKLMIQGFEWYLKPEDNLWKTLKLKAPHFKKLGVTSIWLPPAYKGHRGLYDSGYGVYDFYDLGEFNQKGSIPTKYGTREDYLECVKTFKEQGIEVIVDIVLNHRIGADSIETIDVIPVDPSNRHKVLDTISIDAWTGFNFPSRKNKYSDFKWNANHFTAIDYNASQHHTGLYRIHGKPFDSEVNLEMGNYDYLMGADVDFRNKEVIEETKAFLQWYLETVDFDGVRLDAVKHINASSMSYFLSYLNTLKPTFSVGEYWSNDLEELMAYIKKTDYQTHLFDVPLHHRLYDISNRMFIDLRDVYKGTLTQAYDSLSVQFVDNHDTQIGQSLETWIQSWFRHHANALILLREGGYPCVFYTDLEDTMIQTMMMLRSKHQIGKYVEQFDDSHSVVLGFDGELGYLSVINIGSETYKKVTLSKDLRGRHYYNLQNPSLVYEVDGNGDVYLYCAKESVGLFGVVGGNYESVL